MPGVRRFAKAIDSDDEEILAALMGLEVVVAIAAIGDEEHLTILAALLTMIIEEDKRRIVGYMLGAARASRGRR
jgi:mannitol/fructose-specific phosphotransferase system IIA component